MYTFKRIIFIVTLAFPLLSSCSAITGIQDVLNELTITDIAPAESIDGIEYTPVPPMDMQPSEKSATSPTSLPTPDLNAFAKFIAEYSELDDLNEPEVYPFALQMGSPVSIGNFGHPELGCSWMGIGGQVFDMNGFPVSNLVIEGGGVIEDSPVFELALTGMAPQYGVGGYEIEIADSVIASEGSLWIRVFSLDGTPLTPKIKIDTYDDCLRNLHLINFSEIGSDFQNPLYMPIIP